MQVVGPEEGVVQRKTLAIFALIFVAALWGLTFPLIHAAVQQVSPAEFVALRFILSILIFTPVLISKRQAIDRHLLWGAFIFGSLEAGCYYTQSMGVQTISAAQSAFITSLSVVIAPILAPLFGLESPRVRQLMASLLCVLGVFVLTGSGVVHMQAGVLWTLLCALLYALSVNYLSYITHSIKQALLFVGLQVLFGLPIPLGIWLTHLRQAVVISSWYFITYIALLFCAATTIVTYYLQTRYQKYLPVAQFMLIYALEPVFAVLFAALLNNYMPALRTLLGGGIIILSLVLSASFAS